MPRDLGPRIVALPHALAKGSLTSLPDPERPGPPQTLRFQYNPESISRSVQGLWEHGDDRKSAPTAEEKARGDAQRGGGVRVGSETISMRLLFDSTELTLKGADVDPPNGVLPELSLLQRIAFGKQMVEEDQDRNRIGALHPPEVLLVLGPKRAFPVVITSLRITEQRFSPELVPVRAEVDLELRVLEPKETAENPDVNKAFRTLVERRDEWAADANDAGTISDTVQGAVRPEVEQHG